MDLGEGEKHQDLETTISIALGGLVVDLGAPAFLPAPPPESYRRVLKKRFENEYSRTRVIEDMFFLLKKTFF
jgi:hypothetical protein